MLKAMSFATFLATLLFILRFPSTALAINLGCSNPFGLPSKDEVIAMQSTPLIRKYVLGTFTKEIASMIDRGELSIDLLENGQWKIGEISQKPFAFLFRLPEKSDDFVNSLHQIFFFSLEGYNIDISYPVSSSRRNWLGKIVETVARKKIHPIGTMEKLPQGLYELGDGSLLIKKVFYDEDGEQHSARLHQKSGNAVVYEFLNRRIEPHSNKPQ